MKFLRSIGLLLALLGATGLVNQALAADKEDLFLKGDAKCTECHDEADAPGLLHLGKTKHGVTADGRAPTCTSCHGDSEDHRGYKGKDKPPKPEHTFGKNSRTPVGVRNASCLTCHQQDSQRSHWAGSTHQQRDVACTDCHRLHSAEDKVRNKRTQADVCYTCHKQQRADMGKPSHHPVPEGKMACTDCHNGHGSAGPKLMKRDSVNETCYTCHMEKRGPFVHNHQPVNDDCGNCHNPHGTTADSLLKTRAPFLCHNCHTPHGAFPPGLTNAGQPGWSNSQTITQGRACMNCHTQIHGSNNPSTANPTPQRLFR